MARVLDDASVRERRKVHQAQINANHFLGWMRDQLLLHLAGEHDEPLLSLTLDGTGFHLAYWWVGFLALGELHFNRADFGETHPMILRQRKTRLGVGERVIAPVALKPGIPRRFARFHAPEEVVIGFLHPLQDILKHLRVDVAVLWPHLFDLWQLCSLLIVGDADFAHLPCVPALLESSVVKLSCPVQRPLELFCLLLIGIQSALVSFQMRHASASQYT